MFKLWSEISSEAKSILEPDFGLRSWDDLSKDDKYLIWKHLETYFFNINTQYDNDYSFSDYCDDDRYYFPFYADSWHEQKQQRELINSVIYTIYSRYKARNYAKNFVREGTHFSACQDFYHIFGNEDASVVLELLSVYCLALISKREDKDFRDQNENESNTAYEKQRLQWQYSDFDRFAADLNEVFNAFGINVHLTRNGFMPRQEIRIVTDIYEPVIKVLADNKWQEVNLLLADAFAEYRKNTPNAYSTSVTHTVSAVQAFLQIAVNGKTGSGDISKLIIQGQKEKLIPNDMFTKEIFKNIESILMRERQETGDAHPKKEYASEKNAKLVLNLAMIFFQHCLLD